MDITYGGRQSAQNLATTTTLKFAAMCTMCVSLNFDDHVEFEPRFNTLPKKLCILYSKQDGYCPRLVTISHRDKICKRTDQPLPSSKPLHANLKWTRYQYDKV
eukprot:6172210-Pleurochrysis_carterae.AAC.7